MFKNKNKRKSHINKSIALPIINVTEKSKARRSLKLNDNKSLPKINYRSPLKVRTGTTNSRIDTKLSDNQYIASMKSRVSQLVDDCQSNSYEEYDTSVNKRIFLGPNNKRNHSISTEGKYRSLVRNERLHDMNAMNDISMVITGARYELLIANKMLYDLDVKVYCYAS
jgi:hypothetical protein